MKLDRYSRDRDLWRDWAAINYRAAKVLFQTGDPFLWFPAATLGHHALEMYLKSALIANGLTVFNPNELKRLDAGVKLTAAECAWGHELIELGQKLADIRATFDLSKEIDFGGSLVLKAPMTLREGLNIFDPFFSELRYPRAMEKVEGLGEEHGRLLDSLVTELRHARFQWNRDAGTAASA
jgi:hypothetical protein